jgi:selenocysteine lyase/cysteine desulfurase
VTELVDNMIDAVNASAHLSGTTVLTPADRSSRASIASFRFKGVDQSVVAAQLVRKRVIVSQRFNGVRFSFHVYNTKEDVRKAVDSLSQIVPARER